MNLMRYILKWLLGDYKLFKIYNMKAIVSELPQQLPFRLRPILDRKEIERSNDINIKKWADVNLENSFAFGAWAVGGIVGICIISPRSCIGRDAVWPLDYYEAELTQISTAKDFRNKGIGSSLIFKASQEMQKKGVCRVFAKVWHSNTASIKAFAKAGWICVGFFIELHPFQTKRALRYFLKK